MKRSGFLVWMVAVALSLVFQPALAADRQPQLKEKPPVNQAPATAANVKPLQRPIQLDPAVKMRTKAPRVMLPVRLEQLDQQFKDMKGIGHEYEVGVAIMPEIQKECAEKSYSVQEQTAAGCSGDETLNQCMEKLVHHCIGTFSTPGMSLDWGGLGNTSSGVGIPAVSTQSFREAAGQTAAKARALSQKLQQYATQAERNAAAWK
jgi:hypothetical protein